MSRQRRLMAVGFIIVVAAVGLSVWRPWQKPPPITVDAPGLDLLNPAKLVTLSIVKSAGGPGRVTLTGHYGSTFDRAFFNLLAGETQYQRRVTGPYVIETVTVERDGKSHRQELNVTIPGGEGRRITINADDTVEVGPTAPQ
jgi:hypothetical protein